MTQLTLDILPELHAVAQYDDPEAARAYYVKTIFRTGLWSLTLSDDEASLVGPEADMEGYDKIETGWRVMKVRGQLDFEEVGILADLTAALADESISIFALSTYDTDYLLVQEDKLEGAVDALTSRGHTIVKA